MDHGETSGTRSERDAEPEGGAWTEPYGTAPSCARSQLVWIQRPGLARRMLRKRFIRKSGQNILGIAEERRPLFLRLDLGFDSSRKLVLLGFRQAGRCLKGVL